MCPSAFCETGRIALRVFTLAQEEIRRDCGPMHSIVLALTLAFPVPPNTPLPEKLEHCISEAEICVEIAVKHAEGGEPSDGDIDECIGWYEDCSYDWPEAHEPSCRQSYVWCVLQEWMSEETYEKFCAEVLTVCPMPAEK